MREWLSRMNRDERMGSRRRGRDYYGRMGDMAHNREYIGSSRDRNYTKSDYEASGRGREYDRQYGRDYARRVGYFDYNDDYSNYDMPDYNYDMAMRRDYGSDEFRLTPSEIRKWEKELKRETGSSFSVDQVRSIAEQHNIHFDEFSPELLTVVANMMHSDFKNSINPDITTSVRMAKDFLCDDDFDGTPEEKAYLYYTAIVNKEEE